MRRLAHTLCLFAVLLPTLAAGTGIAELRQTLRDQLAAGRYDAALVTARRCADEDPGNVAIWYNLAGLEERGNDRPAAIAAFRRAGILGFDDFRHADTDEDLGNLTQDPAYAEMRAAWVAGLTTRARQRALDVTADVWSEPFPLPDRRGGIEPPRAEARLRVGANALEIEVVMDEPDLGVAPPWQGGGGLLITVAQLAGPDAIDSRHAVDIGVGFAEAVPSGAVRIGTRWQRLAELTPKMRRDSETGQVRLTATIPWVVCGGIHPLIDRPLGLNLATLRRGGNTEAGHAAWLDDPALGRSERPWRRAVPVRVSWPATTGPALQGRLTDLVVRTGRLELSPLVAVAIDRAPLTANLALRDRAGTLRRQESWPLDGAPGRRQRTGGLTVDDLPPGPARLGVSLAGGSASSHATWETGLVILPQDWETTTAARIERAPAAERPSLNFRLDAIAAELSSRHPLDDPGALGTTVAELEAFLDRVEATGSSIPDSGPYLATVPGENGESNLQVSLAIPDGWRRGEPVNVVLVLARAPRAEQTAVGLAPRVLARKVRGDAGETRPTIMAIPHLSPRHDPDRARRAGDRLISWLRTFLDCGPVHVAGVDLLGATALELGATRAGDIDGLLVITGMNFAPYPDDTAAELRARVAALPTDLPVGWIWFPDEIGADDQGTALRAALSGQGHVLSPSRTVPGGLTFNQAWTRALIWGAGIEF